MKTIVAVVLISLIANQIVAQQQPVNLLELLKPFQLDSSNQVFDQMGQQVQQLFQNSLGRYGDIAQKLNARVQERFLRSIAELRNSIDYFGEMIRTMIVQWPNNNSSQPIKT